MKRAVLFEQRPIEAEPRPQIGDVASPTRPRRASPARDRRARGESARRPASRRRAAPEWSAGSGGSDSGPRRHCTFALRSALAACVGDAQPAHQLRQALPAEAELARRGDRASAGARQRGAHVTLLELAPRGGERRRAFERRRARDVRGQRRRADRARRAAPTPASTPGRSAARGRCPASRTRASARDRRGDERRAAAGARRERAPQMCATSSGRSSSRSRSGGSVMRMTSSRYQRSARNAPGCDLAAPAADWSRRRCARRPCARWSRRGVGFRLPAACAGASPERARPARRLRRGTACRRWPPRTRPGDRSSRR